MIPDIHEMPDLERLIPASMRTAMTLGHRPAYKVNRPDYDRLPLDTFLVDSVMGTEGRVPQKAMRLCRPRDPSGYKREKLSAHNRLLYVFWHLGKEQGMACRILADVKSEVYRHIVLPCDPRHDRMDAFKIACDTVRAGAVGAVPMKNTLLLKALGIEPSPIDAEWSMIFGEH